MKNNKWNTMKNNKWNTKKSCIFKLIYYWLKIVGINPLTLTRDNTLVFSYISLAYGISLTIVFLFISYYVFIQRFYMLLPGETPLGVTVDYMTLIINILEVSSLWPMFGFYQKRVKYIVKSFIKAEKISVHLKIPENYEKHFRILGIELSVITIWYLSWGTFNHLLKSDLDNFDSFIWYCYFMSRLATYNAWILFIWSLMIVKEKFHRLNYKVRFLMRNNKTTDRHSYNLKLLSDKLDTISKLHRELRDLVNRIQRHCALLIFFNISSHFFNVTLSVHIVCRYLGQQERIFEADGVYLVRTSCWIFFPIIVLFILSEVCNSTTREANETGNILHTMVTNCNKIRNTSDTAQYTMISLDLLQNRVRISLFGLLDLDSSFVYKVITTATTYLTIMLQFNR